MRSIRLTFTAFAAVSVAAALSAMGAAPLRAQTASASDTTRLQDDKPARFTYGATAGASHLYDDRQQQSFGLVGRFHVTPNFSISATPAFAVMHFPASAGGGSLSGMTDMPIDVSFDHAVPGPRPLSFGAAFGVSLPVGDTATGFGSGKAGYSISAGVGGSPTDKLSLHFGAGRPLSDFSFQSTLGGSSSTWGDAEASYQLTDRLGVTAGYDGDVTSADSLGAARALAGGLSFAVSGPMTLSLTGSQRISGPAAKWSVALGIGTDFAWVGTVASTSALQRATSALGGLSHSNGRGNSTFGSGHGRGRP